MQWTIPPPFLHSSLVTCASAPLLCRYNGYNPIQMPNAICRVLDFIFDIISSSSSTKGVTIVIVHWGPYGPDTEAQCKTTLKVCRCSHQDYCQWRLWTLRYAFSASKYVIGWTWGFPSLSERWNIFALSSVHPFAHKTIEVIWLRLSNSSSKPNHIDEILPVGDFRIYN